MRAHPSDLRPAPSPQRNADGAAGQSTPTSQDVARARVYELMITGRLADGEAAVGQMLAFAEHAAQREWTDVRALSVYAALMCRCLHDPEDRCADGVEEFGRWARAAEDPFARSLALTARARASIHLSGTTAQLDDMIGAYVAAEHVTAAVERAFALHEVAGCFHELRMWEVARDLYDTVERIMADRTEPQALAAALVGNRFYTLTCELLHATETGDADGVRSRVPRVDALPVDDLEATVPDAWIPELTGYAAACRVLVHRDPTAVRTIEELLAAPVSGRANHRQVLGMLRCVLAWYHIQRREWTPAEALVAQGARDILDSPHLAFRSFALWLRACVHQRTMSDTDRAALRDYRHALIGAAERARDALKASAQARLQTERLRVERDRYAQQSLTDPLTGLANRRSLETELARLVAPSTLIVVDIDRFKTINDRFGHDTGDQVLRRFGHILRDCVRPGDVAARLGGDEFVLLIHASDARVARRRGLEVRNRIAAGEWREIHTGLTVTASVGVAYGSADAKLLYQAADAALYDAKRAGGARVRAVARSTEDAVLDADATTGLQDHTEDPGDPA